MTAPALIVSLLVLCSCSKAKDTQKEAKDAKPAAQQATENIGNFGIKAIDKARAAQKLGDERTRAIDEAVSGDPNRK